MGENLHTDETAEKPTERTRVGLWYQLNIFKGVCMNRSGGIVISFGNSAVPLMFQTVAVLRHFLKLMTVVLSQLCSNMLGSSKKIRV